MAIIATKYSYLIHNIYSIAQFKIDTRVQQTRVHLTDFVEAHASYSHAGCMAREHICTIEYTARERAYTRHDMRELHTRHARSLSHTNRCTRVANAWGEINKVERPSSIIYSLLEIYQRF